MPKKPFYLTGQLDGKPFSVHQEGDRVILHQAEEQRKEIELVPPPEQTGSDPATDPSTNDRAPAQAQGVRIVIFGGHPRDESRLARRLFRDSRFAVQWRAEEKGCWEVDRVVRDALQTVDAALIVTSKDPATAGGARRP